MKRILIIAVIISQCCIIQTLAQNPDPQFSQFFSNSLYLGPSFAGASGQHRVTASGRYQWPGLKTYKTLSAGYDGFFPAFNSGIGVFVLTDWAGEGNLGLTNINLQYSYNFTVNHTIHVQPGLQFGYVEYGLDFYRLKFYDQTYYESTTGNPMPQTQAYNAPENDKIRTVDGAASVLVYTDKIWGGVTAEHLFTPSTSFYAEDGSNMKVRYSVYAGIEVMKKGKLMKPLDETLNFAALFRKEGKDKQLDVGLYWYKFPMFLGVWYRGLPPFNAPRGDALVLVAGYKTKQFTVGYSYDLTISNILPHGWGAHEISLVYKFSIEHKKKMRMVPCSSFL